MSRLGQISKTLLLVPLVLMAQDPYVAAGDHYRLLFENAWVRATRVTYGPHETAPVHRHPPTPTTVYVYVTDGGVMRAGDAFGGASRRRGYRVRED